MIERTLNRLLGISRGIAHSETLSPCGRGQGEGLLAKACLFHSWRFVAFFAAMLFVPGFALALDKNQPKVLAAFRPLVEKYANSTFQVLSEGKRASLSAAIDKSYVVTKASELRGKIEVKRNDGRVSVAEIVSVSQELDLALLKTTWTDLAPVTWGDAAKLPSGSWLVTPGLERDPIGIGVVSATSRKIEKESAALGIQMSDTVVEGGVVIDRVFEDTPAARAGLQAGDIVAEVDGKPARNRNELGEMIRGLEPGRRVSLTVKRGEEKFKVEAVLGNFQSVIINDRSDFQNHLGGQLSDRRSGFEKVIQHDTVLRPSECGGVILDLDGNAVGLNIARAGRVESYALTADLVQTWLAKARPEAPKPAASAAK